MMGACLARVRAVDGTELGGGGHETARHGGVPCGDGGPVRAIVPNWCRLWAASISSGGRVGVTEYHAEEPDFAQP